MICARVKVRFKIAKGYVKDNYQNVSNLESICIIVCELILILIISNHSILSDVRPSAHFKIVVLQLMFKECCPLVYNHKYSACLPFLPCIDTHV